MSSALMCFLQLRHPVDGTPQMCMSIDYDVQKSRLAGEESPRECESIFRCLHAQSGAGAGKPFKTKASPYGKGDASEKIVKALLAT